jgi:hypothetical protein
MSEDRDIDVSHDLTSFVSELRRLADALEHSTEFTIHMDGQDVTIPEGATFSVAHESQAGENELEFQITWSVASDNAEDETDADNDEAAEDDAKHASTEDDTEESNNDANDADNDESADDDVEHAGTEDDTEANTNDANDADNDEAANEGSEDQNVVANGASETARP